MLSINILGPRVPRVSRPRPPVRRPPMGAAASIWRITISVSMFFRFFLTFDLLLASLFWWFSMFLALLFRAWILHRFGMDFDIIFDDCLMIFLPAHWNCQTTFCDDRSTDSLIFTCQKNTMFRDFPLLFRYKFLHRSLLSCCIDFSSFWHQFACFWTIDFWMIFWDCIFMDF